MGNMKTIITADNVIMPNLFFIGFTSKLIYQTTSIHCLNFLTVSFNVDHPLNQKNKKDAY